MSIKLTTNINLASLTLKQKTLYGMNKQTKREKHCSFYSATLQLVKSYTRCAVMFMNNKNKKNK